jgi:dCTP deaminase
MILSAHEITRRLECQSVEEKLVIDPYTPECQQPASYDLRAADHAILTRGGCTLIPSLEWVELPPDLAGTLRCRSSFGRQGVLMGAGFIDPGFRGQLTLCLTNMGNNDIRIGKNERLVQMILQEVRNGNRRYNGYYQDSRGIVEARDR